MQRRAFLETLLALALVLAACGEPAYAPLEPPPYDSAWRQSGGGGGGGDGEIPCSEGGQTLTTLNITNGRADPVDVYWVDYSCVETWYFALESGQAVAQPTYVGNVWVVRDGASGDLLLVIETDDAAGETVTVQ